MGKLRKIGKKIGRAIKKVGKKIVKGIKKVVGKVGKAFGKLGPIGNIAMMLMMPYVPVMWTNLGTFASGLTASSSVIAKGFGYAMKGIYHVGNAAGKVYSTMTNAIKGTLNFLPGGKGMGLGDRIGNFFSETMDMARNTIGLPDPASMYSEASLKYLDFKQVNPEATLGDFQKALNDGQLNNTIADQGQAVMERVYKDNPAAQKENIAKYKEIAASGERPVLEYTGDDFTGEYKVMSESEAVINRSQFEGYTRETPYQTEWVAPSQTPEQIKAAAQASYREDLIQAGVPETQATIDARMADETITVGATPDEKGQQFASDKIIQKLGEKGIEHLISTDPEAVASYRGSSTTALASEVNAKTSYSTRPEEINLPFGMYANKSYNQLYNDFLGLGLMTRGNNNLMDMYGFGATPNFYGAGMQNYTDNYVDYILSGQAYKPVTVT